MAQRSIKFYGMGFVTEQSPATSVTVELDGQQLFQGQVLNHQPDGTELAECGEEIFVVTHDPIIGGMHSIKIAVTTGKLTVSNATFNQTWVFDPLDNPEEYQTKDGSAVPSDIDQRVRAGTHTDADLQWLNEHMKKVWFNSADQYVTVDSNNQISRICEPKRNVKINGVLQEEPQVYNGTDNPWHWTVTQGDVIEFDLIVPRGADETTPE